MEGDAVPLAPSGGRLPREPQRTADPFALARVRRRSMVSNVALAAIVLALPMYYGVRDVVEGESLAPIAQNLVNGLSNGSIIALLALGYTLVYGIIELINFAHGDVFMIGSLTARQLWIGVGVTVAGSTFGIVGGIIAALVVAMVVSGVLNVLIERVAYRPLRSAPKLAPLITAIGMAFVLENVALLWIGGTPVSVEDLIGAQKAVFEVFGVTVRRADVLAFAVTVPLVIALSAFVSRSRLGRAMRATAQAPEAAKLMGINVDTTISVTFLIGGMLAGAAGVVYALYQTTAWYLQGFNSGLLAFTAAVMGGIGNLRGAVLGGLLIGCVQQVSDSRIGPEWTPAVVFGYLILIIVVRPQGLLGEQTREAG